MIFSKIGMCLTNFSLIKQLTKKLSAHFQNWFAIDTNCIIYRKASTKLLPVQNIMRRVDSPANPKIERRNFQWMFRSFYFRKADQGFKGSGTPLQV